MAKQQQEQQLFKKKKRTLSAFDRVANLELEDQNAEKLRRQQSTRDVSKAKAARSQVKIFGNLMETRILLQRSLQQEQKYDPSATRSDDENSSDDDDDDDNKKLKQSTTPIVLADACDDLLEKLLQARRSLVPGLEQEEESSDKDDVDDDELLQSEYQTCRDEWKEVLNRRHQDLRLHAGLAASSKTQFRVLDSSFWQQVESTVNHEEMRQQRESIAESKNNNNNSSTDVDASFDDSKVYQHMLKDFLVMASNSAAEGNTNGTNTPYQRMKTTKNKQVDRKASKGRKIRYVEIPKLVNFTFPMSRTATTNLDEDEWFQSLLGGVGQRKLNRNPDTIPGAITTVSNESDSGGDDDDSDDE